MLSTRSISSLRFLRLTLCAAACSLAALACAPAAAAAQEDPRTRAEVGHLLDYLAHSGCQFNRNGTWHAAPAARDHLQEKYDYLKKRSMAPDANAFIERAATGSSMTGQAYQVRCGSGQPVPSARWLNAELERYRAAQKAAPVQAAGQAGEKVSR